MAAVTLQVIPIIVQVIQTAVILLPQRFFQNTMWVKKTLLLATMTKYACYPNERDLKELLQKLGALCFNYELVDCLYTVFKYQFSGKIDVKSAEAS